MGETKLRTVTVIEMAMGLAGAFGRRSVRHMRVGIVLVCLAVLGLVDGATVSFAAGASGRITGRVTDAMTGLPIENASACEVPKGQSFMVPNCATTNANGEYTLGAPTNTSPPVGLGTGEYDVRFSGPESSDYVLQYYDGKTSQAEGNPVSVSDEETTSGIDAALRHSNEIACPSLSAPLSPVSPIRWRPAPAGGVGPSVELLGRPRRTHGTVLVPLRCAAAGAACGPSTAQLAVVEHIRGGRVVSAGAALRRATRTLTIVIGSARVTSWEAGRNVVVRVRLSSTGRKLAAHHKGLRVRVLVTSDGRTLLNRYAKVV